EGFFAGQVEEFAVTEGIGDVKSQVAGLARAEKFARAAKLQVGFGDFESVRSADHGFEAGASVDGHMRRSDKNAVRLFRTAANAPAQFVQLRQAKTFVGFDDLYWLLVVTTS